MSFTYVMSDIHGNYEKYAEALEAINFQNDDTLFVLGDVLDRGQHSIKILQDMLIRSNVIPLIGNHEYMAIQCLHFLMTEITHESIASIDENIMQGLFEWQNVGGQSTIDEFHRLSVDKKQDILNYLEEFSLYEEITVNNKDYVLVHAGLDNFSLDRPLNDYHLHELIFKSPDYLKVYYPDKYLVTGHIPTRNMIDNACPDFIYKANNHIAIDCGCGFGGKLGVIRLDDGREFYV